MLVFNLTLVGRKLPWMHSDCWLRDRKGQRHWKGMLRGEDRGVKIEGIKANNAE